MFTGIIEAIGTIRALTPKGGDVRVLVDTGKLDLGDVKLGDSIAVTGVVIDSSTMMIQLCSASAPVAAEKWTMAASVTHHAAHTNASAGGCMR